MQRLDGQPVFSATDLVGFLACGHLTALELAGAERLVARPIRPDPELDLIQQRGLQHEHRYLAELEAAGRRVTSIAPDDSIEDRAERLRRAAAQTAEAIRRGDDVIYQATFFDGRWLGLADFLLRVEVPSLLGSYSYEVADTKLARHTKASALLQICSYVEQLTVLQGLQPEWMHVALGGSTRAVERHRVADYMAYYRQAKRLFEQHVAATTPAYPPLETYPDPVEHCDVCRWSELCTARRRADDDLSRVAGISGRQRDALRAREVPTRRGLAGLHLPLDPPLERTSAPSLARVHLQARLQVLGEDEDRALYEPITPARLPDGSLQPNRGLFSLPEPSPGDLFFDIEGDPYAFDDGVEYLFGVLEPSVTDADGNPTFHAFWARDDDGQVTLDAEKRAFEELMDFFIERLERDPGLHIYHYAPYEPTALGRLMGRHGTREAQVDRLLRGDILVDLYRTVRQGIRASVESYSIKKLEPLYGFTREIAMKDAGSSIVAFEAWLQVGGDGGHDDEALHEIERYNRDDVVSTLQLRGWLEERRSELADQLGEAAPRPQPSTGEAPAELSEALAQVQAIADRLMAANDAGDAEPGPDVHARWLLAQLLSWHRREEKSFWWNYFRLMEDLTDDDRIAEREPMGGLTYLGVVEQVKRSNVHRYRFPPQEHGIQVSRDVRDPATGGSPGSVVAIDEAAGTIDLSRGVGSVAAHPASLVPYDLVGTTEIRASLLRVGEWVADHGIDADGPYRAARDLLRRMPPRVGQSAGQPLAAADQSVSAAAVELALALDESCLPIQGPPGSGKTHTGAEMILALVAAGKQVGVTANSHKVIGNLLDKVVELAAKATLPVRVGQRTEMSGQPTSRSATPYRTNEQALGALRSGAVDVVGATAWTWSRVEFAESLEVLVIDEAGQLSLANAVAVSPAARSLILLGDPQQLDQPLKGSHPPGADRSALAHLLDGASTMPPEQGLFLDQTWRLHPDLCRYTSEVFYEDRLEPRAGTELQALDGVAPLIGTGVRFIPVQHTGNDTSSAEEADRIAELVAALMGSGASWTNRLGETRDMTLDGILVVAAYNAQVGEITRRLPGARVGTVDKFQGQEAPISIYSMASSTAADAPRGMEFLYSLNRLNVATSRARCLTIVVASPELVRVRCRTPRQMRLANALCRLVELAEA